MSGDELTAAEAKAIHEAVRPTLAFLTRLAERLAHLQFGPEHGYYVLVVAARDAVHALSVGTHYRTCEGGVGRPPG